MSVRERYQAATYPVRCRPDRGAYERGWNREPRLTWDEVAEDRWVGGNPRPGHVLIDVDDKGDTPFSPEDRLAALSYVRRLTDLPGAVLISHTRTQSRPQDAVHGHWLLRVPVGAPASLEHPWGQHIRPDKLHGVCRGEGYRVKEPYREIGRALGELLAGAETGDLGGCNILANDWAFWLGRQGADERATQAMWRPLPRVWRRGAGRLRRTVEGAYAAGRGGDEPTAVPTDEILTMYTDLPQKPPPLPDLLGLLHSRHRVVVAGPDSVGKTTLAAAAAISWCTEHDGSVLWIDGELAAYQCQEYLQRLGAPAGMSLVRADGHGWMDGDTDVLLETARRMVGEERQLLTVVDSGTALASGIDEDSWNRFLGELDWRALHALGGVLLIEHTGVQDSSRPRGPRNKTAEPDEVYLVREFAYDYAATEEHGGLCASMRLRVRKDRGLHRGAQYLSVVWSAGTVTVTAEEAEQEDTEARQETAAAIRQQRRAERDRLDEEIMTMRRAGRKRSETAEELDVTEDRVRKAQGRDPDWPPSRIRGK